MQPKYVLTLSLLIRFNMGNQNERVNNIIYIKNNEFFKEVLELVNKGRKVTIPVRGYSMRPFLEDRRDKVTLIAPCPPSIGDPVMAEIEPGVYVLHRVIDIKGKILTLKGDGNLIGTESCNISQIVACVDHFIRKEKIYTTKSLTWRIYSHLWLALTPFHAKLLYIYRHLPSVRKTVKKYRKHETKKRI